MKHILLLCAITLGFYIGHAQDEAATDITVDEIIDGYFENTGGVDNWHELKSMRVSGSMAQGPMEFPGVIISARPNKQRVEVDLQGQKIIQAYDGTDAWWINPFMGGNDPQIMPAEMAESMVEQSFESDFLDYAEKGHKVELLGTKEVDGAQCYEVKLTKENGTEEWHYFDMEYMVPIMQKTIAKEGPYEGQAAETYLSDYEEVGDSGIIMPMYMETRVMGAKQFSIRMSSVELDVEVNDEMFAFPKNTEETDETDGGGK